MLTPKFTCRAVIFFLAWLVQLNIFTEATFFCMMVGHTYSRIDQTFRTLIGYMMARALWTVEDMITAIAEYLNVYNCLGCMELHCMWAWKDWFRPHVYTEFGNFATSVHACHAPLYCLHTAALHTVAHGLRCMHAAAGEAGIGEPVRAVRVAGKFGSGMHEFLLRKDREGHVRLWYRKSSQATSWLPDGDGMLVFKSLPEGHPELKKGKADSRWRRDEVERTVKAWFKYMSVLPTQAAKIKSDWQARFEALPPDGDVSQLPAAQKLVWIDLPRDAASRGVPADAEQFTSGNTRTTENPPINPVTGKGRTAADVERELRLYKTNVRAIADTAIFQADFLFVKLEGEGA